MESNDKQVIIMLDFLQSSVSDKRLDKFASENDLERCDFTDKRLIDRVFRWRGESIVKFLTVLAQWQKKHGSYNQGWQVVPAGAYWIENRCSANFVATLVAMDLDY